MIAAAEIVIGLAGDPNLLLGHRHDAQVEGGDQGIHLLSCPLIGRIVGDKEPRSGDAFMIDGDPPKLGPNAGPKARKVGSARAALLPYARAVAHALFHPLAYARGGVQAPPASVADAL
jgi:hypothetical protein